MTIDQSEKEIKNESWPKADSKMIVTTTLLFGFCAIALTLLGGRRYRSLHKLAGYIVLGGGLAHIYQNRKRILHYFTKIERILKKGEYQKDQKWNEDKEELKESN